jgi:hypothetical protein
MNLEQASNFLAGGILTMLGFVMITIGIVVINNILHRYWKPVQLFKFLDHPYPPRFVAPEEDPDFKKKQNG